MKKYFPWWLSALLGLIIYPCLTYLPEHFLEPQWVELCKNIAPLICMGLFLYGAFAIYENPIENTIKDEGKSLEKEAD